MGFVRNYKFAITIAVFLTILIVGGAYWLFFKEVKKPEDKLQLALSSFDKLDGWKSDDLSTFLPAIHKSCAKIQRLNDQRSLGANKLAGVAGDWKALCKEVMALPAESDVIRSFVEKNFTPFEVRNNEKTAGLFTGYYEASLNGSLTQSEKFATPL